MLADWDAGAEQDSVDGPALGSRVVDIMGVNADESGALIRKKPRRVLGKEGVVAEIVRRTPVRVPPGCDQHSFAAHIDACELRRTGGAVFFKWVEHDDPIKFGDRSQRQMRKVATVGVAMERRIHIGAGIGDHVDAADLEA